MSSERWIRVLPPVTACPATREAKAPAAAEPSEVLHEPRGGARHGPFDPEIVWRNPAESRGTRPPMPAPGRRAPP